MIVLHLRPPVNPYLYLIMDIFSRKIVGGAVQPEESADHAAARLWVADFIRWYNQEHRHIAIRFVTPEERHSGGEGTRLRARHARISARGGARPNAGVAPPATGHPSRKSGSIRSTTRHQKQRASRRVRRQLS